MEGNWEWSVTLKYVIIWYDAFVLSGDITLSYCITEEMLADLLTKIVTSAQDKRLAIRFYNDCIMDDCD